MAEGMSLVFGSSGPHHEGSLHQGVACLGDAGVHALSSGSHSLVNACT